MTTTRRPRRRTTLVALVGVTVVALAGAWVADSGDAGPDEAELRRAEVAADAWTIAPHEGVGAWVDVYDWTNEFTDGAPPVGTDDIDRMADLGIETLYLQTAHDRSAAPGVIEPERLADLIDRAHSRGIHVVAWVLPMLVDEEADLRRLRASAELPVEGLGVDIESLEVTDPIERNRRLLQLTDALRAEVGDDKVLAAITPSPVHLQVVNPDFWPAFPWIELAESYDVVLPMSYWSIREPSMRDGEVYVADDIARVRTSTGDADIPIHVIGGIADAVSVEQVEGMVRALADGDAVGGSLYDWATSSDALWEAMAPLRTDEEAR